MAIEIIFRVTEQGFRDEDQNNIPRFLGGCLDNGDRKNNARLLGDNMTNGDRSTIPRFLGGCFDKLRSEYYSKGPRRLS